jgi:proline iminopeptidase
MKKYLSYFIAGLCFIFFVPGNSEGQQTGKAIAGQGYFPGAGGLKLYYQFKGSGKDTIVMIHGGPGMDAGYMVADFETLAKKHVLLFYDQRGGGRSALPDTATNKTTLHIDRHIDDLEALRKYFSFSEMNLLGHSFGTIIAGKYAIAYPENVRSMILIGSVPPYAGDFGSRYEKSLNSRMSAEELKQMELLGNEIVSGKDPKKACRDYWQLALKPRIANGLDISVIKGDCCSAPAEGLRYGYKYTQSITWNSLGEWDFREALKKVRAPVLLIHGEEESIPMDMVEVWTKFLPNSELKKIPKAAHFPYAERPGEVWPLIESFLQEIKKN